MKFKKTKHKELPGSLIFTGDNNDKTQISHIIYSEKECETFSSIQLINSEMNNWIVFEGLNAMDKIQKIQNDFSIDPLVLEDVLNPNQRTKIDIHDDYIFYVIKYPYLENEEIKRDYISLLHFQDKLITFSESKNRFIDDVLKRITNKQAILSKMNQDYLLYVIFDMIIDETLLVYNYLDNKLDYIEENIIEFNQDEYIDLYHIRKELMFINHMTDDLLENKLEQSFKDQKFFDTENERYFDDLLDHIMGIRSKSRFSVESTKNSLELFDGKLSNKLNQTMTTLTIFSAIFIPLSFIAGVFGMNFVNFDILQSDYGLVFFGLICLSIIIFMFAYFKIKKWF